MHRGREVSTLGASDYQLYGAMRRRAHRNAACGFAILGRVIVIMMVLVLVSMVMIVVRVIMFVIVIVVVVFPAHKMLV